MSSLPLVTRNDLSSLSFLYISNKSTVGKGMEWRYTQSHQSSVFLIIFSKYPFTVLFFGVSFSEALFCLFNFWNTLVTKRNALANSVQTPRG